MTALKHRVGRDGLNDDLLHEIAAILDDAAQRIERIIGARFDHRRNANRIASGSTPSSPRVTSRRGE